MPTSERLNTPCWRTSKDSCSNSASALRSSGARSTWKWGDQDFYLDLLLYHLRLRCFVVVDLKARDFTPEAAGKMNFYLSAVDDRFRLPGDQPSIGLILCRAKNRIIAEYALRDLQKPIGVSGYVTRLVECLPQELQAAVPSVKEIESGLSASATKPRTPRKP